MLALMLIGLYLFTGIDRREQSMIDALFFVQKELKCLNNTNNTSLSMSPSTKIPNVDNYEVYFNFCDVLCDQMSVLRMENSITPEE